MVELPCLYWHLREYGEFIPIAPSASSSGGGVSEMFFICRLPKRLKVKYCGLLVSSEDSSAHRKGNRLQKLGTCAREAGERSKKCLVCYVPYNSLSIFEAAVRSISRHRHRSSMAEDGPSGLRLSRFWGGRRNFLELFLPKLQR